MEFEEEEDIDFSLSTENLNDIPFHKYENNFTFIVNGKKYYTSRVVADLLSPIIREYHYIDETINEFSINTIEKLDVFEDFLSLSNFENALISKDRQKIYSEYFYQLGNINEYIKLHQESFEETNHENAVGRLISISQNATLLSNYFDESVIISDLSSPIYDSFNKIENVNDLIAYIASNFESINKNEMKSLSLELIEEIISNENLKLKDEDSLLNFILELYQIDNKFSILFEYVIFSNVEESLLETFIEKFNIEDLNKQIWNSICNRLLHSNHDSINNDNINIRRRYTSRSRLKLAKYRNDILDFDREEGKEFSGIMKFLVDETGGNIHDNGTIKITSNSINADHHPKNLVDYQNNNFYHSKDDGNAIITFDFKDKLVKLSSYSIQSYDLNSNWGHLKNWVVEASNDDQNWIIIDRHQDDSSLNGPSIIASFDISDEDMIYYRFIRIRQTGNSWFYTGNHNYIYFPYIEFYGKLKPSPN